MAVCYQWLLYQANVTRDGEIHEGAHSRAHRGKRSRSIVIPTDDDPSQGAAPLSASYVSRSFLQLALRTARTEIRFMRSWVSLIQ